MLCRTRDIVAAALFATSLLPVLALSAATGPTTAHGAGDRPATREGPAPSPAGLSFSLGVPDLDVPAVQYALFDEDPSARFTTKMRQLKSVYSGMLAKAGGERREQSRRSQMSVVWDGLFRTVTGDKVNLLRHHSTEATIQRGTAGGGATVISSTVTTTSVATFTTTGVATFTSNGKTGIKQATMQGTPRIVPTKKKWLVTKVARRNGEPVCWCLPLEPGHPVELTADNTFDLAGAYTAVMGE